MEVKFKQYRGHKREDYISFTRKEIELIEKNLRILFKEELNSKDNFIDIILYGDKDLIGGNNCNYFEIVTELFVIRVFKTKNNTTKFQFIENIYILDKFNVFNKNNWKKVYTRIKWIIETFNNTLKLLNTDKKNKIKLLYNNTLKEFNSFLSENKIKNHIVKFDNIFNSIEIAFEKYILTIYININELSYIVKVVNESSYINEYDVNTINTLFNFYKERIKDYL